MQDYRVKPGARVNLAECDPNDARAFAGDKKEGLAETQTLVRELEQLQELLYAEHKHKVLVVLQGMDTAGKDGVIRRVFEGVNPQGVRVASFKAPTPRELDHDFLWRIHARAPGRGEIVIFNRSHYEDVLIVRVHNLIAPRVWRKRYAAINEFERMLAHEGTTILKFFLHIDADEQKQRLQARLDDPSKQWKFSRGDLQERKFWGDYVQAYEDMLSQTSTAWAPWHIVPANRKWYRDWVISRTLVRALKKLDMQYPQPIDDLDQIQIV